MTRDIHEMISEIAGADADELKAVLTALLQRIEVLEAELKAKDEPD